MDCQDKKTILIAVLLMLLLVYRPCTDVYANAADAPDLRYHFIGSGSPEDPFQIGSLADLRLLRDNVDAGEDYAGVYFAQTADLVFPQGENWNPIGNVEQGTAFRGIYDGQGHSIDQLICNDAYGGLFSYLGGMVKNLSIESGKITGNFVGSVTSHGTGEAVIVNCVSKADVFGNYRAGGIADNFPGEIVLCWSFGEIKTPETEGTKKAGVASYGPGEIRWCASTANPITGESTYTGSVLETRSISETKIPARLEESNSQYAAETERYGELIPPVLLNGGISFPGYATIEERFIRQMEKRYQFSGKGTEREPFQINSLDDLRLLRDNVDIGVDYLGCYFEQTGDLVFPEGENWDPIGDALRGIAFRGRYDGCGHTVSYIYSVDSYAGLFSLLNGEVRNLGIESGLFIGNFPGSLSCHGLEKARIINCYNKGAVMGRYRAGGLVDDYRGLIMYSWNLGPVEKLSDDAVTDGVCSYGGAELRYCHSVGAEPASSRFFTGVVEESFAVSEDELAAVLAADQAAMANESENNIDANHIVFLAERDGTLIFTNQTPEAYAAVRRIGYLPMLFLGAAVILMGVLLFANRRKLSLPRPDGKTPKTNAEEQSAAPEAKTQHSFPKKTVAERVLALGLTGTLFVSGCSSCFRVLIPKRSDGIVNYFDYQKQENKNTDILLIGASGLGFSVELSELWKEYGFSGYCLDSGGASFRIDYYRMAQAWKSRKPELVILDAAAAIQSLEFDPDIVKLGGIIPMEFSANKWKLVNAAVEPELRLDYFLGFPVYHHLYNMLGKADFSSHSTLGKHSKAGWTAVYVDIPARGLDDAAQFASFMPLAAAAETYLRECIEWCQDHDTPILLYASPTFDRSVRMPYYNTVALLAEEYGVNFLNVNYYDKELDLSYRDFWDVTHVNMRGARKCTAFVGEYLKEHYDLTDHRGDEAYESWELWQAEREDSYLRLITENEDYFAELLRDSRRVAAIPFNLDADGAELFTPVLEALNGVPHEIWITGKKEAAQSLGGVEFTIEQGKDICTLQAMGKTLATVTAEGLILVVYDELTNEFVDIATFSPDNGCIVTHQSGGLSYVID